MPHYVIIQNEDGTIKSIEKDGASHETPVQLEQHYRLSSIFFESASECLEAMSNAEEDDRRRKLGIQSFIMVLTGLEAFVNTFFHQISIAKNDEKSIEYIQKSRDSLTEKIRKLIKKTSLNQLYDQDFLLQQIHGLSQLRNELVHTKWSPTSIEFKSIQNLRIEGLTENRHRQFEEIQFCKESILWCMLLIARIYEAIPENAGKHNHAGFLFRWTGTYGFSLERLVEELAFDKTTNSDKVDPEGR